MSLSSLALSMSAMASAFSCALALVLPRGACRAAPAAALQRRNCERSRLASLRRAAAGARSCRRSVGGAARAALDTPVCSSASLHASPCASDAARSQAAEALEKGKQNYASGERMAALKGFENALQTMVGLVNSSRTALSPYVAHTRPSAQEPSLPVRRELLYSAGCCHAAFGDIENAWICFRGAFPDALHLARSQADAPQTPSSWAWTGRVWRASLD